MLPLTADTVRLSLHVLAATVWVGGQFALAGLLPSLRALGEDAPPPASWRGRSTGSPGRRSPCSWRQASGT